MATNARSYQATAYAGLVQDIYLQEAFLRFLRKRLVIIPLGKRATLPENSGRTVRWNYFTAPTTAITNLTGNTTNEGTIQPSTSANGYTLTSVTATLTEFSNWMDYSKVFNLITQSGSLDEVSRVMAYEAAFSMDTMAIQRADGTTATLDSGTAMRADFLRQAVEKLENADVPKHPMTPGGAYYAGVFSAEAAYDMMGEGAPVWFQAKSSDWQAALVQPWDDSIATSALYNCIIKVSNNVKVVSSNDQNLVLGDEEFGVAALGTDLLQPRIINTPPESKVDNPIRNAGTLGWWAYAASVLLQSTNGVCIFSDADIHTNADVTLVTA